MQLHSLRGAAIGASLLCAGLFPCAAAFERAAWYFGDDGPGNFWESFQPGRVDSDLFRIKGDGFNAIFLAVPWDLFDPGLNGRMPERQRRDLALVVAAAGRLHLGVYVRAGYYWDYDDRAFQPRDERFFPALYDPGCREHLKQFLTTLDGVCRSAGGVSGTILSWEDFWRFMGTAGDSEERRLQLARESGFQAFLQGRYSLEAVERDFARKFGSFSEVPLPSSDGPAYAYLLEFFDHGFSQILDIGRSAIPGLSAEVRVDFDPVRAPDGRITWFDHSKTYRLAGASHDRLFTYWAPFMWEQNRGETVDATEAIHSFDVTQDRLMAVARGSCLFVDQFNFVDNSPGMEQNARLAAGEVPNFIARVAPVLYREAVGYGIWTYQDYTWNKVIDSNFSVAGRDWVGEGWRIVSCSGQTFAHLSQGGALRQAFNRLQLMNKDPELPHVLNFWAQTVGGMGTVEISLSPDLETGQKWSPIRLELNNPGGRWCRIDFPANEGNPSALGFRAIAGEIEITHIRYYSHIQSNGFYDTYGSPGVNLSLLRDLNATLARFGTGR